MNLRQMLLILRLRWWLVLLIFLISIGAAFGTTQVLTKRYTASTSIILDLKTDPLLAALAPALAAPAYMATQTEIMQSERLAGRVVRMMGLAQSPAAVAQWREETDAKVPLETYYGDVLRKGLVVQPGKGSQIMTLTYHGTDPNFAAAAANTFAKAYIDFSVELRTSPARENASFFEEKFAQLKGDLEAAQTKVSSFQQSNGVLVSTDRFDQETSRLASLEAALASALAEQAATISVLRNSGTDTSTDVAQSAAVQNLRSQLAQMETRLAESSQTLGANHPTRVQLDAQIKEIKDQLTRETRRVGDTSMSANKVASQKIAELRGLVEAQKRTVLGMRAVRDQGSVLIKELEAAQRAFDSVNNRRSQLSLEAQADQAGARVLSPATAPLEPSSPNLKKNLVAGALLGLLLGLVAAIGWELLDRRVRTEEDMRIAEGVPVLGVLSNKRSGSPLVRRLPSAPRIPPQLTMSDRPV
jgi:chain length determinant protein EpsF